MKHLKKNIKTFLTVAILLTASSISPIFAQYDAKADYGADDSTRVDFDPMDSVEVSLLTCSPHEEIYSLYGHSAIRWHNLCRQSTVDGEEDWVFNWGMFNFKKPYFALRFVFGITDYELGVYPYSAFWPYYKKWGSSITEQVLNLTADEKRQLQTALSINLKPENKVYRYNYFYDNCSTRPRDIIEKCINGQVVYKNREDYAPSYREMVHECVRNHPWAKWGNDMLLGIRADQSTSREQQEFLPINLMQDFATASIYSKGEYRPLVKEQRTLVPPGVQMIESDFPLTPTECAIIFLLLSLVIFAIEWKQRKKTFVYWDVFLMTVQGLAGCILFVMLFSQHPTTTLNLNIILFNPLPLFFIPAVIRRKASLWWSILLTMLILYAISFLVQDFAEGMGIVALCLLLRYLINRKYAK